MPSVSEQALLCPYKSCLLCPKMLYIVPLHIMVSVNAFHCTPTNPVMRVGISFVVPPRNHACCVRKCFFVPLQIMPTVSEDAF
jgi:hypothetical protein